VAERAERCRYSGRLTMTVQRQPAVAKATNSASLRKDRPGKAVLCFQNEYPAKWQPHGENNGVNNDPLALMWLEAEVQMS
jgi:hypothetical protein